MSNWQNRPKWVMALGLSVLIAATAQTTHAAQPKTKDVAAAEAKLAADEDAREAAEGESGKQQRTFGGVFSLLPAPTDSTQTLSPDVVGSFITDASDAKPNRSYLVKVDIGNKSIMDALKRSADKKIRVTGKLRVINENGEAKYLIVFSVLEAAATPAVTGRRKVGGV
jgi:hypothetical protein